MTGKVLFALLGLLGSAASSASDLRLPDSVVQGGLVIGRVDPLAREVRIDERPLRVGAHGEIVFGVGRDHRDPIVLHIEHRDGARTEHRIEVRSREFRVERVDGLPQKTVTPDPETAARIAAEQAEVTRARARDDPRVDFSAGFLPPAQGRVSGVYGSQRILNGTPRSPHMGLDIAAPEGAPVVAPAAGLVTLVAHDYVLTGGTVLLDHGHGLSSSFLHLSRIDVETGSWVQAGQQIGAVGATGRASGPHLHWGMNWFEVRVDPQLLLEPPAEATP